MKSSILYGLPIAFYCVILYWATISTSRDIEREYTEKTGNKDFQYTMGIGILGSFLLSSIACICMLSKGLEYLKAFVLTGILCTHLSILFIALVTDRSIKRINRFTLRIAYVANLGFLIDYLNISNALKETYFILGICMLVLLVGFFFDRSVGASDYRCLFITIPTMIVLYEQKAMYFMLLYIACIVFYHTYKKRLKGLQSVPIGDKIMLFATLLLHIYMFDKAFVQMIF